MWSYNKLAVYLHFSEKQPNIKKIKQERKTLFVIMKIYTFFSVHFECLQNSGSKTKFT